MKKLTIFLFILSYFGATAQQNLVLYNMPAVQQTMYANPGQMPQCRINVGFPLMSSMYFNFGNSGFKVTDVLKKTADDSLELDMDNFLSKLRKNNYISQSFQLDLVSFGFKVKENYFSFSIIEKENFSFRYPKAFFDWAWKGNGAFLGQDMNFNFGLNATHYREYGLGYARTLTEKLSAGFKVKYLNGMENVSIEKSDIVFNTGNPYFDYTTRANIQINSSGVEENSFKNFNVSNYLFKKKNSGLGIDLGAVYKFSDRLTFSGSIIDLGYIKWKSEVTNYTSAHPDAEFKFDGIDIAHYIPSSGTINTDSALTHLGDSIKDIFKIDTTHNPYTTVLPMQVYAGVNFKINEKQNAGMVLQGQFFDKSIHTGLALSYNMKFKSWFSASVSYAIINRAFNNIGVGFALTGPVQWYMITDNVLGFLTPQSVKTINFRTGINLCFGRRVKDDKSKPGTLPATIKPTTTKAKKQRGKDIDKDGVPNKMDKCPTEKGLKEFSGCPDRDGDNVPDNLDECPDSPGLPEFNGCPDKDGDKIVDKKDSCPDIAGLAELNGCPDRDGDKVIDKLDSCPDQAGLAELNGCPDRDGDKVIDKLDSCPDNAGLVERNGCPDKDGDGVLDKVDRCPDKAGSKENDGCPLSKLFFLDRQGNILTTATVDKDGRYIFTELPTDENFLLSMESEDVLIPNEVIVVLGKLIRNARRGADGYFHFENLDSDKNKLSNLDMADAQVRLTQEQALVVKKAMETLEFDLGKEVIRPSSLNGLDQMAELLAKNPAWRLKISGHTDNVSSLKYNMSLSKKRVESVKKELVKKGVDASHIILKWYGPTKPVAPNNTEEGRQKNRRVEFLIIR